jgi:ribosomal protein S18 acetylase RimI-like enzyme
VALLRHYGELPEESRPYWRLLWDGGNEGAVAHSFHNGTTYVFGEREFDWGQAGELCRTDLLPERIVGDRAAVESWQRRCPELFRRALDAYELDVLVRKKGAGEPSLSAPEAFRIARLEDLSLLEEYEQLHCREVGLEPVEVDFKSLIENDMAFVVEHRGRVAGCVRSNLSDGRYVHVGGVYVHPEFRGRRLGQRLATGIAWWVEEHQRATALLDVYTNNPAALRAYRAAGYRKVGEGLEVRFGEEVWR